MDRILVAGDLHISLAVRAWLEPYGLEVTVADGGVTGIFALDNSTFDLMIVDIFMLHIRGLRKSFTPATPMIVINECLAEAQSRFADVV